ncbi:hypothetical protein [Fictibacillus sp. FJAT-27399]|nr:hypothetical protein [Fictibacillus sp. FJAT-27399]
MKKKDEDKLRKEILDFEEGFPDGIYGWQLFLCFKHDNKYGDKMPFSLN